MSTAIGRTLTAVSGCAVIGYACMLTNSADPLWAMILLAFVVAEVKN